MRILCVHQGWELYGSDRTFIQSVRALRESRPTADIVVDLPRKGPLSGRLAEFATSINVRDMSVLRRRRPSAWVAFVARFPLNLWRASRRMREFDVAYVNTIAPIDYGLASRLSKTPTVIHIHEIPRRRERQILKRFLQFSRASLVFNSHATLRSFGLPPDSPSTVVHNGTPIPMPFVPVREGDDTLRLLCIGRFNSWKGQNVLIASVKQLPARYQRRLHVRFVGDAFEGQSQYLESIRQSLDSLPADAAVSIEPFTDDPSRHYEWCDIVVVPSTQPEPFGLVAIEAMAMGRPVIASNHGGLTEIVLESETGRLVRPNCPTEMADAILSYLKSPQLIAEHGALGRERARCEFSLASYDSQICSAVLGSSSGPGSESSR